jgi:hypothetical protein
MIERETDYETPRTDAYVGAVANLSLQGISVALVNDTLSDTEEYKVRYMRGYAPVNSILN